MGVLVLTEVICAAAALYASRQIIIKCVLYWYGLRGPDATLYFTMGTALHNGIALYGGIFDPKPPAIFLLSALSLGLFSNAMLAEILNIVILLCIPVLFVLAGYFSAKKTDWVIIQFSTIVGITLALYHATIGGDIQTEFYGAFFGLLYLAAVNRDQMRSHTVTVTLASGCFAVAVLFKEPFLLTLFAASLLMLKTRREWLRLFGIPLLTACVLYCVVLLHLGGFQNYFTLYLRGMLGNYILAGGPVWARGLVAWERMYINVLDFSAWFPLLILALFLLSLPAFSGKRGKFVGMSFAAVCIFMIMTVRSLFPEHFPWWQLWIGTAGMLFAISLGAFVSSIWQGGLVPFLRRTWRHGLALYITLTAIGLGSGFHGQYFALALPVYFAFFLLFLRRQASLHPFSHTTVLGCTALSAAILLSSQSFTRLVPFMTMTEEIEQHDEQDHADAAALDAVLDACTIDRYYYLEGSPLPYAKHSPLNFYLYTRIEHIGRFHPLFFDETFRRLGQSQIIIEAQPYVPSPRKGNVKEECIGKNVQTFLQEKFTKTPRACATNLPMPGGYQVLFRKNPQDISQPDILRCKTL